MLYIIAFLLTDDTVDTEDTEDTENTHRCSPNICLTVGTIKLGKVACPPITCCFSKHIYIRHYLLTTTTS